MAVDLVNDAGIQFRIDRHLLAGHGVEGEPGRDFRDAAGALGDDHEIDHHQNEKDDRADDVVAAHHEVAEGVDDMAGVAVDEDEASGGDVERESIKSDCQQQGRETGELRRVLHVNDDEQHQEREADAGREQQVEHEGWHRHDQEHDRSKECPDKDQVALF